ncbi:hypothetical protein E0493_06285 [Roseomonas sp. M0104]|uniref:Uncharacterized protein n=1 Tax=Teichococcus coralli TaxID=2545983 RepID=A0A845BHN1_9PROT|nr:hypothetical protein [Pseudoroseomonas coralli]MXP62959.1 hypothetical protein [Pseudoroseomonas coralli]
MDTLRTLADHSIRRVLGCIALGIALVMLALASRPLLALQSGALLTAATWLGLWGAALQVPRQDLRRTALWRQLAVLAGEGAQRLRGSRGRQQLASVLAERLMWHADRAAFAAAALGSLALAFSGYRLLLQE